MQKMVVSYKTRPFFALLSTKDMDKGTTFIRLMRCFRCMLIDTEEPPEDDSLSVETMSSPIVKERPELRPPGIIEPSPPISDSDSDGWVLAD